MRHLARKKVKRDDPRERFFYILLQVWYKYDKLALTMYTKESSSN
jgi:hypothetical protein